MGSFTTLASAPRGRVVPLGHLRICLVQFVPHWCMNRAMSLNNRQPMQSGDTLRTHARECLGAELPERITRRMQRRCAHGP